MVSKEILGPSVAFYAIALSGCINMSSLQTAETLPPNTGRTIIGGGYYTSPSLNTELKDAEVTNADIKVPYLEGGYRYGFPNKFEVGAKVTIIGTIGIDGKYQFLDGEKFDMAAGVGIGYLTMDSESSSGEVKTKHENLIIDAVLPLYVSYRVSPGFAVYATPKAVYRNVGSTSTTENTTTKSTTTSKESKGTTLAGSTVGVMFGEKAGLALEGTYLKDLDSKFSMLQTGFGIFW